MSPEYLRRERLDALRELVDEGREVRDLRVQALHLLLLLVLARACAGRSFGGSPAEDSEDFESALSFSTYGLELKEDMYPVPSFTTKSAEIIPN